MEFCSSYISLALTVIAIIIAVISERRLRKVRRDMQKRIRWD